MRPLTLGLLAILACGAAEAANAKPAHHHPASSVKIPATGVLTKPDLMAVAMLVIRDRGRDQFSDSGTNVADRRAFRIVQDVAESNGSEYGEENSKWSYNKDAGELTFALPQFAEIEAFYQEKSAGSYVGQNAFGVKRRIKSITATRIVLEPQSRPDLDLTTAFYQVTVPAPSGDEARRLSLEVQLIVEGTLTKSDGAVASCQTSEDGATIDNPVDVSTFECDIHADITRIAFVDLGTGKVLKEWGTAPATPTAP